MKQRLRTVRESIISIIDFFYPPFQRIFDLQTFRYAACGGVNSLFDITLFSITYNYVLQKSVVHLGSIAISPHIAAMITTFPVTLVTGFVLMRYVVFPDAKTTSKRVQGGKYATVVFCCILLNYMFLK